MDGSTILVPIDFQDASLDALAAAREMAGRLGLEVVLLHVYTVPLAVYPGYDPIMTPGLPAEIAATARKAIEKLAADEGGLRWILTSGDPVTMILETIDAQKPAIVAMGTHGRKGIGRFFLGSVAERIVRLSPVPVLTIHAKPR